MSSDNDVELRGRLASDRTFCETVLLSPIGRVAVHVSHHANSFKSWRIFIFMRDHELKSKNVLVLNELTCEWLDCDRDDAAPSDSNLQMVLDAYEDPERTVTVQRVLEIAAKYRAVSAGLSEQEVRSGWGSLVVQIISDLMEQVPLSFQHRAWRDLYDQIG
ncbi:hypothetical protein CTheo_5548 [Ceratobasidium theobromae]|uniref:Uncharacterized protein n=1 Tax=Ceratobasidium theobromae TaxID=1582974 RepID=A0A5N5QH20_9AGAM|nr:hypothetical protein CTheo_5548 [Ceratobasidium theobromae]